MRSYKYDRETNEYYYKGRWFDPDEFEDYLTGEAERLAEMKGDDYEIQ